MTVSRVMNGAPRVSEEMTERVRAAAARIGYRRNDVAASLRRGPGTTSIGVVIENIADPFYAVLMEAIEDVAREKGYLVLVGSCREDADLERQIIEAFCSRRVDGLVIVPASPDHSFLLNELTQGTAAVFVDRPPQNIKADTVLTDNAGGARDAVRHLVAQGHRRIGYLSNAPVVYTRAERLRGYRSALSRHKILYDADIVRLDVGTVDQAEQVTRELLRMPDPPSAIFTANNRATIGALKAIGRRRSKPALVGFDDFELADMVHPPVTVVTQDPYSLGRKAAELLFARLAGKTGPPKRVVLSNHLVIRGSGEVQA